jgi:hypothetical protein
MSAETPIPGTYQHYKGGLYEVLGVAEEPESGKQFVVYRSLGVLVNRLPPDPANNFHPEAGATSTPTKGELTVCSIARFTEEVDGKEYSGGRQVPRFSLVSAAPGRD